MKLTSSKTLLSVATVALASALSTSSVHARGESELTRLAHRLDNQVAELRHEIDDHLRSNAAYRHLVNDTNEMYRLVQHIDRLSHGSRSSYGHLREEVAELGERAKSLHELLEDALAGRYGRIRGNARHLHDLLFAIDNTIDSMKRVVGIHHGGRCGTPNPGYDDGHQTGDHYADLFDDVAFIHLLRSWFRESARRY